jgi:hypothetical protein
MSQNFSVPVAAWNPTVSTTSVPSLASQKRKSREYWGSNTEQQGNLGPGTPDSPGHLLTIISLLTISGEEYDRVEIPNEPDLAHKYYLPSRIFYRQCLICHLSQMANLPHFKGERYW